MSIEFNDGSNVETDNWNRLMSIAKQLGKDKNPSKRVTAIKQGGVTVKLDGIKVKPDAKIKLAGPEHANFIESRHRDWKIRVWTIKESDVYGCNYYLGEDVRYIEVPCSDVADENGVFKYVSSIIEDLY